MLSFFLCISFYVYPNLLRLLTSTKQLKQCRIWLMYVFCSKKYVFYDVLLYFFVSIKLDLFYYTIKWPSNNGKTQTLNWINFKIQFTQNLHLRFTTQGKLKLFVWVAHFFFSYLYSFQIIEIFVFSYNYFNLISSYSYTLKYKLFWL